MLKDSDSQFFAGITGSPESRAKLAQFLKNLEDLDLGVRTGLLKTWLHVGVLSSIIRKACFLRDSQSRVQKSYPMDAIIAPFGRCNLRCRGCYALGELGRETTSVAQLDYLIGQLKCLNVYHVMLVGKGEPFFDERSKHSLYEIVRRHPQILFSVYSNGTNLLEKDMRKIKRLPNLIPVVSIDGAEDINDWRRGKGVYRKLINTFQQMHQQGLFFGYISTVFHQNYDHVLDSDFVSRMAALGCKLGYYSLFLNPDGADCQDMMLGPKKREEYFHRFRELNAIAPIPLIDIDGVERDFGCRAKRGATVFIDAITGKVSPCIRISSSFESGNIYRPARPERLSEILDSESFNDYRDARPTSNTCEAFHRAERAHARDEGRANPVFRIANSTPAKTTRHKAVTVERYAR